MARMDNLKLAVRQWGVRALCLRMTGNLDEETQLRLALHAGELAQEMGLNGGSPAAKATAIREAFNEDEPLTMAALVAAHGLGDAGAVALLQSVGIPAP